MTRDPKEPDLLDLPLGPRGEDHPPAPEKPSSAGEALPAPDEPFPSRRRWLVPVIALALVAVGVLVGVLWPRGTPAVAILSSPLLDFGQQRVQAEGTPQELVVSNRGTRSLRVESVALTGAAPEDFRVHADGCTGRELDAVGQCTVLVGFAPTGSPGARSAALEVVGDFGNSPIQVPLLGSAVAPVLSLNRHALRFGPRPLGVGGRAPERLVVTNRGSAALELGRLTLAGTAAGDFERRSDFCSGRTLRPDERCTVEIAFRPTAEGERSGALEVPGEGVATSRVELGGIGIAPAVELTVEPAQLDFGEASLGQVAGALSLDVLNPGNRPVEVTRIEVTEETGEAGFRLPAESCTETPLEPGARCAVRVDWQPAAEGELTGELVLRYLERRGEEAGGPVSEGSAEGAAGVSGEMRVALRGIAVTPRLELRPEALVFGEIRVGSGEGTATARLANRGSGPAQVSQIRVLGEDSGAFSVEPSGDCFGRTLASGSDCSFQVGFRPRRTGSHTARLVVRSDAADPPPEVGLEGTGVAPRLVSRPQGLELGRVVVSESAERSVVLANEGTAPATLGSLTPVGAAAADFRVIGGGCRDGGTTVETLAPGDSCRLEVRFTPRAEGRRTARLRIGRDLPDGPVEVVLRATALPAPKPELSVKPSELRFGDQGVGQRSGIETLTLENTGTARLHLRGIRLGGADAGDFQLVAGTCDGLPFLAPGGDCSVGIRFVPTGPGSRRARLEIRHDAAGGETAVPLAGLGLESSEIGLPRSRPQSSAPSAGSRGGEGGVGAGTAAGAARSWKSGPS